MNKKLLVITSPSGAGKTTIANFLKDEYSLNETTSITTRKRRDNEIQGQDYLFIHKDTFEFLINQMEFVEYSYHYENYYGTTHNEINTALELDKTTILVLDVNGAKSISELYPNDTVSIFIQPPSKDELLSRLLKRGDNTISDINNRLDAYEKELEFTPIFNHVIINDDLNSTLSNIEEIIKKECFNI